eukprot:35112-Amphidinium_carterae.1
MDEEYAVRETHDHRHLRERRAATTGEYTVEQPTTESTATPEQAHHVHDYQIQRHPTKITKIMKDAGLPQQQINLAFGHFDERAAQHFMNPNVRTLADMNEGSQPMRETRRAIQEAERIATADQETQSDGDEDELDYDTSYGTTKRATDSAKKRPIKGQGKTVAPRPRARTVQNFFNARINNFHAAPIPMEDAKGEDTSATPRLQRYITSQN